MILFGSGPDPLGKKKKVFLPLCCELLTNQESLQIIVGWHTGEQPRAGVRMIWCTPFPPPHFFPSWLFGWMKALGAMLNLKCVGLKKWVGCRVHVMQRQLDLLFLRGPSWIATHTQNVCLCVPFLHSPPPPPPVFFLLMLPWQLEVCVFVHAWVFVCILHFSAVYLTAVVAIRTYLIECSYLFGSDIHT